MSEADELATIFKLREDVWTEAIEPPLLPLLLPQFEPLLTCERVRIPPRPLVLVAIIKLSKKKNTNLTVAFPTMPYRRRPRGS